ncbi:MAG: ABC transporter ATP-binding protein [Clostridiaceae bacterium]|jgi:iron complex transport system ATP-binding protein|nr:ABC transporter ATP-binding protein [Clostridiaceae bacterium]
MRETGKIKDIFKKFVPDKRKVASVDERVFDENNVIACEALSFAYRKSGPIFENVSFSVDKGEILTLLGVNGAGKSTLLNCIATLLTPKSGEIFLCGKSTKNMSVKEVARVIGYVPQVHNFAYAYTVREFVVMGRTPYIGAFATPRKEDYTKAEAAISMIGIEGLMSKAVTELSGGEKQQVSIARAIAQESTVIMLDEPTAHLDYGNQARTIRLVKKLSEDGYTIILTTHIPDHPIMLGGRVAVLEKGGTLTVGEPETLLTEERLSSLYGMPIRLIKEDSILRPVLYYNIT